LLALKRFVRKGRYSATGVLVGWANRTLNEFEKKHYFFLSGGQVSKIHPSGFTGSVCFQAFGDAGEGAQLETRMGGLRMLNGEGERLVVG